MWTIKHASIVSWNIRTLQLCTEFKILFIIDTQLALWMTYLHNQILQQAQFILIYSLLLTQ